MTPIPYFRKNRAGVLTVFLPNGELGNLDCKVNSEKLTTKLKLVSIFPDPEGKEPETKGTNMSREPS
jgi:hypothetical protein